MIRRIVPEPLAAENGQFRFCRSCFGHIAGEIGVAITRNVAASGYIRPACPEGRWEITPEGRDWLESLGVGPQAAVRSRGLYAISCMDLTEQKPHLAGPFGVMLLRHFKRIEWLKPVAASRRLEITERGWIAFSGHFGISRR